MARHMLMSMGMNNTTKIAASLLTATVITMGMGAAHAEDANTTVVSATNTVVVVTPNQPTVVGGPGAVAPAPVVAAPSAAPIAAGPGAIDPDVSQINGHPVPVGTHNEYRYSFRKTNIAVNPIGWMIGIYGVSASHALSNNIAIRGDVTAYVDAFGDSGESGVEVGLSAPIYLRRTYQGPFVEPGILVRSMNDNNCYDAYSSSSGCGSTASQMGPQILVGYHVSYDSGFNMAAAFGVQRDLNASSEYGDDILPAGYFRVGYAF